MADPFLSGFRFEVHLSPSGEGGDEALTAKASFTDVSGLETSIEMLTIREGGYNKGVRQLIKKTSQPNIVLKRGVTSDAGFWEWVQRCFSGEFPLPYISGSIHMLPRSGDFDGRITWNFVNGLATKVSCANLDAKTTTIPIEELHIAHEGLSREL